MRADGDALVMHVGERPYIVATAGPIELSAHGLNLEAMSGMLSQLLPPEALASLDELGAVEHELAPDTAVDGNRFAVVAARGGDDIWIEIRRHRSAPADPAATGTNETAAGDAVSTESIFVPLDSPAPPREDTGPAPAQAPEPMESRTETPRDIAPAPSVEPARYVE